MKKQVAIGIAAVVFSFDAGCSSSRSTMLSRNECNTGWNKIGHLHGTPITLKVPTHLRIYIYEKYYMEKVNVAGVSRWQRADIPTLSDFGSEVLYTDKIFTTDFIRPAAGAFNLDVNYTPDQYVQRVQQDITDETLKDVTALLATLPGKFFALPSAVKVSGQDAPDWKEIKSVVAANVFEIDDPNFEANISEFVHTHLNCRATTNNSAMPQHQEFVSEHQPIQVN